MQRLFRVENSDVSVNSFIPYIQQVFQFVSEFQSRDAVYQQYDSLISLDMYALGDNTSPGFINNW